MTQTVRPVLTGLRPENPHGHDQPDAFQAAPPQVPEVRDDLSRSRRCVARQGTTAEISLRFGREETGDASSDCPIYVPIVLATVRSSLMRSGNYPRYNRDTCTPSRKYRCHANIDAVFTSSSWQRTKPPSKPTACSSVTVSRQRPTRLRS